MRKVFIWPLTPPSGLRCSTGLVTVGPVVETASVLTSNGGAITPFSEETLVTPSLLTCRDATLVMPAVWTCNEGRQLRDDKSGIASVFISREGITVVLRSREGTDSGGKLITCRVVVLTVAVLLKRQEMWKL